MKTSQRTHTCGEITLKNKGESVKLCGWINSRRDHGGLIFFDIRDRYGLTQVVFDPNESAEAFKIAETCRSEFVIQAEGAVRPRPKEMINSNIPTGEIEILVSKLAILTKSKTPPFEIDDRVAKNVHEEKRLKYRYLDLRRNKYQKIMKRKDELFMFVRNYLQKRDFVEVQTPILANPSPEGARDYLVPSRMYKGKFFALPQAPQQFKQLLMVAGLDRYFQIAPCFRDEDPRSDRHPGSFYQIDIEMSFVNQEDVWELVEGMMIEITKKFSDKKTISDPFPRMTWKEVMDKYGSDKPDLRYDLGFVDVTNNFKNSKFEIFAKEIVKGGVVKALRVPGGAKFSRKEIDNFTEIARENGLGGLGYITYKDEVKSPLTKYLSEQELSELQKTTKATNGDIVFFACKDWEASCKALGAVRKAIGESLKLADPKKAAWLWVVDFPMYQYDAELTKRIDFSHNPFSMPQGGMKALQTKDPLDIVAYQYDLVLNGFEISSGAIRNHETETMYKAFEIAGYTKADVDKKFGHMAEAFQYGTPPHGGIAPGVDRLLMVLWDLESIRDVYAFPLDGTGKDVMTGAPLPVDEKQLKELGIKTEKNNETK